MTSNTLTDMTLHVSCEKTFRRLFYYPLNEHFFNLIFLRLTFFLEKKNAELHCLDIKKHIIPHRITRLTFTKNFYVST